MKPTALCLMILLLVMGTAVAAETGTIGTVKTVQGEASILRSGETIKAEVGTSLRVGDTLLTGTESSMGVIFRDDSALSLGSDSTITIDTFIFEPAKGKLGFLARIVKGTATFLAGIMAKLDPDSTRIETPKATIGIRGTHLAVQVEE